MTTHRSKLLQMANVSRHQAEIIAQGRFQGTLAVKGSIERATALIAYIIIHAAFSSTRRD